MDSGSIEKLCEIFGHASVATTELNSNLASSPFDRRDYETATVDLTAGADVVEVDFRWRSQAHHSENDLGTVGGEARRKAL
jgi:hypothetical protein